MEENEESTIIAGGKMKDWKDLKNTNTTWNEISVPDYIRITTTWIMGVIMFFGTSLNFINKTTDLMSLKLF